MPFENCLYASGFGYPDSFTCFWEGSVISSCSTSSWLGGHHELSSYNFSHSSVLDTWSRNSFRVAVRDWKELSYTSWSNQAFGPPYCAGSQVFTSLTCSLHIMKCSLNTFNAGWGKSDMSPLEGKTENRSIHHHKILHRQHSPHQHTSSTYAFVLSKVLGRVTTAYSLLIPFRENDMRSMYTALDPLDLIQRNHIVTPRSWFEHVWVDHSQHLLSNL